MEKDRDDCIRKLIDIQYVRNDQDFKRGTFRVRGDVVEVYPSSSSGDAIRVEFFGEDGNTIEASLCTEYTPEQLQKVETTLTLT